MGFTSQSDKDTLTAAVNSLANAVSAISVDPPVDVTGLQQQITELQASNTAMSAKLDQLKQAVAQLAVLLG